MKTCTRCRVEQTLDEFNVDRSRRDGLSNACRACRRGEYRAATSQRKRRGYRISRYGLTHDEWLALLDSQGQRCALCRGDDPRSRLGWHTDHDHETGRVRGIVCYPCNALLGYIDKGWMPPGAETTRRYFDKLKGTEDG